MIVSKKLKVRIGSVLLLVLGVGLTYRYYADRQVSPQFRTGAYKAICACERVAGSEAGAAGKKEDESSRLIGSAHAEARTMRDRQIAASLDMLSAMSNSIADAPPLELLMANGWNQALYTDYEEHHTDALKAFESEKTMLKKQLD